MHIAYLTPEYPNPKLANTGGLGTSIKNLAIALAAKGIKVTIFIYGQKVQEVYTEDLIHFHVIKQKKYKFGGFYFYRKYIERYVKANLGDIDLIEAPDWTGITAFMRFKIPLIIRFHGSDTYFCHLENRRQKIKNKWFERLAMKPADAFIAPTHFAGLESIKLFKQPLHKLKIIHYGLSLKDFNNRNPDVFEPYRLLNIGTLIRKKGVFQIVKMFNEIVSKHPNATLYLIGADSYDIKTNSASTWALMQEQMSEQAKAQTTYLGKVPYIEVQKHIRNANICVFPSMAETLGMVTIEAMALQKVVLNTDIGWAQDIITHNEDGFMHHPNNIKAYVDTILRLFEDKDLISSIGIKARQKVETRFDIETIVEQNITYYKGFI